MFYTGKLISISQKKTACLSNVQHFKPHPHIKKMSLLKHHKLFGNKNYSLQP